jgi:hypothetical protein
VSPTEEDACRALAAEIQESRPGWLVLWGCFSHRYVAFPLLPVRRRVILIAYYPDALISRMDETERIWQIHPEPEE